MRHNAICCFLVACLAAGLPVSEEERSARETRHFLNSFLEDFKEDTECSRLKKVDFDE